MLSNKAVLEMSNLSLRAEQLARGGAADRLQASILTQRIASIRQQGISSDEVRVKYAGALAEELGLSRDNSKEAAEYRTRFDRYVAGREDHIELRDFLAGQQTLSYTEGIQGGYMVPFAYDSDVREAMAQTDRILSEDVTDFTMTAGPFLQPQQVSGYDLSTIAAALVGETVQQTAQVIPTVAGGTLKSNFTFRVSLGSSLEAEQDVPDFSQKIVRASSVALARAIGQHVISGIGGTNDINGISRQLSSSYMNGTGGKITLTDLNAIYFGVNRWYRAAPKAGWLVSDGGYKLIRAATDTNGRPLLDVIDDQEMLLGKPLYLCPSLGSVYTSIGLTGALVFGDLSHIVIRASRPTLQRITQSDIVDVTKGESLFIGRCRADALVFDPSSGNYPPLTLATLN